MKEYRLSLALPVNIYEPLKQIADVTGASLDEVILQTLKGGMPPSLRKVPEQFHAELLALNKRDDVGLWDVIQAKDAQPAREGTVYETADFPMLRRAYAFSLLKWRGHPMPSPHEMMLE